MEDVGEIVGVRESFGVATAGPVDLLATCVKDWLTTLYVIKPPRSIAPAINKAFDRGFLLELNC